MCPPNDLRNGDREHPDQDPELLTLPRAARRVGVGVRQIRRAVKCGDLPAYQVGAWPRVRRSDLSRWISSQRVRPTDHAHRRLAEIRAQRRKGS
jgi:excisionase family DNA binding protein